MSPAAVPPLPLAGLFALLVAALLATLLVIARLLRRARRDRADLAAFEQFSNDWAWAQDPDFKFTAFAGGSYRRQHLDLGPLIGTTRWEPPERLLDPQAMAAHRAACERHEPFHDFQYGVRFPDGTTRWFVTSGYPVFDRRGRFAGYRGLAREDTERVRAERALRLSEHRIAAIAAGSPVPMFALDSAGRVILWNRGCEVVLGITARDMLGRDDAWRAFYPAARPVLANCVMGDDPAGVAGRYYEGRARPSESIPGALEAEAYFPDIGGRERWLFFVAAPMRDEHGEIVGAIETLQDVTERRRAEGALEARNAALRALIDNMPGGVSVIDANHRLVTWNAAFLSLLDLPASLFDGDSVPLETVIRYNAARGEYGPGETDTLVEAAMTRARLTQSHVLERRRPDGTVLEIRGSAMPGGGFVTVYTDITARKAAEEALRLHSAYLHAVIDHLPQGVSVFDQSLRLKHWNGRFAEILDLPAEVLNENATFEDILRIRAARGEYGPGDLDAQVRERRERALRFEPHRFERTRPSGMTCLVEGRPMAMDGRVVGFVTTYTDVTEARRVRAEVEALNASLEERVARRTAELRAANERLAQAMDQLVQSEKLAALGGLVAGVAHELNTPLGNAATVASAFRERVAQFRVAASGPLRRSLLDEFVAGCDEAAHLMQRNVDRAAQQIAHFKQVAVDQTSERRRRFDLRVTIEEIAATLHPQLKHRPQTVAIEVPDGIEMDSFPGPLEQVIVNLIDNALTHAYDAEQGGTIHLRAQRQGELAVRIEVADNGRGMPAEVRNRAFDPFFTTRLGKGGSGLGLYIVFNLVTSVLGGSITLASEAGWGTRHTITLPLVAPAAGAAPGEP